VAATHHNHIKNIGENHRVIRITAPSSGGGFYAMPRLVSRETSFSNRPVNAVGHHEIPVRRSPATARGFAGFT
jgi:hypothetical protein